jgi:mRNA interferase MazF
MNHSERPSSKTTRYKKYDVIVVPFPFSDSPKAKRRPALVLSGLDEFDGVTGQSVCAMITSAKNSSWPLDIEIKDLKAAGLPAPSVVRMKIVTVDHRLVVKKSGSLAPKEREAVAKAIRKLLDPVD